MSDGFDEREDGRPTKEDDDGTGNVGDGDGTGSVGDGDGTFERELARARELLADGEEVSALHVGVVRGDRVDSTAARRSDGERAGLETLALLASHLRTVAEEAGVDRETVAADAARLAGEVETLPADDRDDDDHEPDDHEPDDDDPDDGR